jgi:hypothetical protein
VQREPPNSIGEDSDSSSLEGAQRGPIVLCQLPDSNTKLSSLEFTGVQLQLQPGRGYPGVLGAAAPLPLKQLQLNICQVLDNEDGLMAALARLPGLEHLSIVDSTDNNSLTMYIPLGEVLLGLQQLTYLELEKVWTMSSHEE